MKKLKKQGKKGATVLAVIAAVLISAFFVGVEIGISAWKYYAVFAVAVGAIGLLADRSNPIKERMNESFSATLAIFIIALILLGFGSCINGINTSHHDPTMERIEITGHPY